MPAALAEAKECKIGTLLAPWRISNAAHKRRSDFEIRFQRKTDSHWYVRKRCFANEPVVVLCLGVSQPRPCPCTAPLLAWCVSTQMSDTSTAEKRSTGNTAGRTKLAGGVLGLTAVLPRNLLRKR